MEPDSVVMSNMWSAMLLDILKNLNNGAMVFYKIINEYKLNLKVQ